MQGKCVVKHTSSHHGKCVSDHFYNATVVPLTPNTTLMACTQKPAGCRGDKWGKGWVEGGINLYDHFPFLSRFHSTFLRLPHNTNLDLRLHCHVFITTVWLHKKIYTVQRDLRGASLRWDFHAPKHKL